MRARAAVAEACHDLNLILRSALLRASRRMAAGLMVRDARLHGLLTMRVSLAHVLICPRWQIKSGHWAAANQPDGQITSDFPKLCQAPKSKIFLFSFYPNQLHIHRCLVRPQGRSRVVTKARR